MIEDLKIAILGWYLGIIANMSNEDVENGVAWQQPEMKKIMGKYNISKDDVLNSIITGAIHEYVVALTESHDGPLSVIFQFCDKNRELLKLLHKNNLLHLLLQKLNSVIPEHNHSLDMTKNPFAQMIGDLEPDYLIAFNIGAIWNVIFKWVDRGMVDSPEDIKATLEAYLKKFK